MVRPFLFHTMAKAPKQHKPASGSKHQHKVTPRYEQQRDHASSRGYDRRWAKFRAGFLIAHPLCEFCLGNGKVKVASVVDHDIPHRGDKAAFWDNSFTALCASCHNGTKSRLEQRYSGQELLNAIRQAKSFGR